MPDTHTSVLLIENVLDADACAHIRAAMDVGVAESAEVLGEEMELDEGVRRAAVIEVDEATLAFAERALDDQRPVLERFYGVALAEREGVSLLRYVAGGRFRPHRDRGDVPSWPGASRRLIAVVLFLSASAGVEHGGDFRGGVLRLLDDDGQLLDDIPPRAGTLVAFPATMLHEVTLVTGGVRDTAVDWFYESDAGT
jgi:predicted 2-oxoglutarate/Fe(II)-dependent dioxygenase YbiX